MASPSRLEIPPSSGGDMEQVFRVLDADGDGKISESELGTVVRALGSNASPEEVKTMIGEMDSDQDGFVDMKEFAEFNAGGGGDDVAELRDAFDMYDLDHNGVISASELHLVLKRLGDKSSVHDCARMISSLDKDGDGYINFEEFKVMMSAGSKKVSAPASPIPPSQSSH